MYVIKMTNGRGYIEWYSSLAVRVQARRPEHARHFASQAEAEEEAQMCMSESMQSAFSGCYWNSEQGRWTLVATVEPFGA